MKKMKYPKEIYFNNVKIAKILNSKHLDDGLTFFTEDDNTIQIGSWKYKKNKILPAHYHNTFKRESFVTQEAVYVVKGKIKCEIYEENGNFISSHILSKGDLMIQFSKAHQYIMLKDSIVLEFKNGPYFGAEKDRTRISL